jgi:hypothetical protein
VTAADGQAVADTASVVPQAIRRSQRWRMWLIQILQLPALGLVVLSPHPSAWWVAGIWGSICCCAGTDSQWRWRNRLLVAQAVLWLLLAGIYGGATAPPVHH